MIKVGYDAGHGYNTAGKRTPDGEREWTFNDIVARAFANELALYSGVASKRFDDPSGKTDVPLATRTNGANSWVANYYISFHHNALAGKWGTHTGVETFTYTGNQPKSLALAKAVHPAVVQAYGLRDRGIKQANLAIVRDTKMPAILIEGGFMDSTIDIKKLRDKKVLENAGKLIAQAFAKYVGLKKTPVVVKPVTTPTPAQPVNAVLKSYDSGVYTVVKGDTLSAIAKKHNTTVALLQSRNNIANASKIYVGQKIVISILPTATAVPIPNAPVTPPKPTPVVTAPKPVVKPVAPVVAPKPVVKAKTLYLPKTVSSWAVYPTNKAPVKANAVGYLNPKKFGGLSYEILATPQTDVVTIKTSNYGKVNIYVAKSTGATIK